MTVSEDLPTIKSVLSGKTEDFALLLDKYGGCVTAVCRRHVPQHQLEDAVQETFIRAYKSLPGFDLLQGDFKKWAMGIAIRTCYDYWRKQYRNREVCLTSLSSRHSDWVEGVLAAKASDDFWANCKKKEAKDLLVWALEGLSPEDRMVTELVYFEGLCAKEAASVLGWTVANVRVRCFRAKKKLKKRLSSI